MPRINISTGISLYYEWYGDADGPPVVFIRGTGADSSRWMPQVNEYKDKSVSYTHLTLPTNREV